MTDNASPQYVSQPMPAQPVRPAPPTNALAVVSLIAAILVPPAGLVLGIMAQRQIARTGESGAGLALAGVIVGGILTGLFLLFFFALLGWILTVFASVFGTFASFAF